MSSFLVRLCFSKFGLVNRVSVNWRDAVVEKRKSLSPLADASSCMGFVTGEDFTVISPNVPISSRLSFQIAIIIA